MTISVHGDITKKIKQSESSLKTNINNVSEYSCSWIIGQAYALAEMPDIGDVSPTYSGLFLAERELKNKAPNLTEILGTYRGVYAEFATVPPPVEFLRVSTMDRPIQNHPKFNDVTKFPQTEKVGEKKTEYDADGNESGSTIVFSGFKDTSAKRGIEGYMVGTMTWVRRRYTRTKPGEEQCYGCAKVSFPTGLVNVRDANHWLKTSMNWEQQGAFWVLEEQWTYSGDDLPWDPNIYGTFAS